MLLIWQTSICGCKRSTVSLKLMPSQISTHDFLLVIYNNYTLSFPIYCHLFSTRDCSWPWSVVGSLRQTYSRRLMAYSHISNIANGRPMELGRPLYFHAVVCSFFFPRLISAAADLMTAILHTWCGLSANLECMSEMCCMRLAENTGRKKSPKIAIWAPSHKFVGLYLRK